MEWRQKREFFHLRIGNLSRELDNLIGAFSFPVVDAKSPRDNGI